jgi:hypothetical protein
MQIDSTPCPDFVEDQHHAMGVAVLAHVGKVPGGGMVTPVLSIASSKNTLQLARRAGVSHRLLALQVR